MKKIYLFATIFAILTGLAVFRFAGSLEKKTVATNAVSGTVVAALQDIPENTSITQDMITLIPVPEGSGGKAATDAAQVVGKITRYPLVSGEYILPEKLADPSGESASLAYSLEKGKRAVSVSVDDVIGVSGYLTKGDRVDIIAILIVNQKTVSMTLVENVKVIALGVKSAGDKEKTYQTATLAVTPAEALKIAYATSNGRIILSLRPVLDNSTGAAGSYQP